MNIEFQTIGELFRSPGGKGETGKRTGLNIFYIVINKHYE